MISKKSRKVVAALLIGATVCASGTFAYFNSKLNMDDIEGIGDNTYDKLAITNGHVEITGKMNGATAAAPLDSLWGYDVARVSTVNAISGTTDEMTKIRKALGLTSTSGTVATLDEIKEDDGYILKHRSTDIANFVPESNGTIQMTTATKLNYTNDSTTYGGTTVTRANIGAPVLGPVAFARPGDAFVFGLAKDGSNVEDAGLEIFNKSNITTKLGMRIRNDGTTSIQNQIESLEAAGWKFYLKITGLDATTNATMNTEYKDYREIDLADFARGDIYELVPIAPGTNASPVESSTNGTTTGVKIQIRVELPILTGNTMMDADTTGGNATDGAIDILNLFEIVATQENNPGWTQAGTTPATGTPFTNKTGTDIDTATADPTI